MAMLAVKPTASADVAKDAELPEFGRDNLVQLFEVRNYLMAANDLASSGLTVFCNAQHLSWSILKQQGRSCILCSLPNLLSTTAFTVEMNTVSAVYTAEHHSPHPD